MIVLPDLTPVPADEAGALDAWIRQGGTLIRFAGPRGEAGLDGFCRFACAAATANWAAP